MSDALTAFGMSDHHIRCRGQQVGRRAGIAGKPADFTADTGGNDLDYCKLLVLVVFAPR